MEIRKATPNDLPEMLRVYAAARQFMKDSGNPTQWGDSWPPVDVVEEYTKNNGYVVLEGGKIVAAFGMFENYIEPSYAIIDGAWLNDKPYTVVHTLGSDGSVRGIVRYVLDYALQRSGNVRVDTHAKNAPMLHVLNKDGWHYCGVIWIEAKGFDGELERFAFQKTL